MTTLLGTLANGISVGSLYALVAVGFTLVFTSSGVIDFARGQLVVLGTLTSWYLGQTRGVPAAVTALVCVLGVALVGAVQERAAVWPVRGEGRVAGWLVSTLAFGILVQAIASNRYDSGSHSVPAPVTLATFHIGDVPFDGWKLVVIGVAVAVAGVAWAVLRWTRVGRCLCAVAEDREAAGLRGINVTAYTVGTFAVAGALAGLAGFVFAPLTSAFVEQGPLFTIKGFVAMVVGGTGSIWGALAGGWVLGCAEQLGSRYISGGSEQLFGLAVLLAVLLARPQGLFASRRLRNA